MTNKQRYFVFSNAVDQKKNFENLQKQTQHLSNYFFNFKSLGSSDTSITSDINSNQKIGIDYNFLMKNLFIKDITTSDSVLFKSRPGMDEAFTRLRTGYKILPVPEMNVQNQNFVVSENTFVVLNDSNDAYYDTVIISYSIPNLVYELNRIFDEQYLYLPAKDGEIDIDLSEINNPLPHHVYNQVQPEVCNQINRNLSEKIKPKLKQQDYFNERVQIADTVYSAVFLPVFDLKERFEGFIYIYFIDGYYKYYFSEFIKRTIAATISLIIIFFLYYRNYAQQVILIKQNISIRDDQKQLQIAKEKAEESNLVKSEFLANMSHEIRTPMNTVLGFTDLLNAQITDPQHKKYLAAITSGTKNLLYLINDILDLSKIEAGKMMIVPEAINLRLFFSELESVFSDLVKEKRLDFVIEVDNSVPQSLYLDEIRLKQIMFNLIGNAIKFTEKGFIKIGVLARPSDETNLCIDLIINVKDSGIGIHESYQTQIFNAFQQQDNKLTKKYGGTGLGLSISQKLAHLMNGDILLESQPNMGSIFTVFLKKVEFLETEVEYIPEKESQKLSISFEKAKVLIVDDVGHNRYLLKEYLNNTQLTTFEALNGSDAIDTSRLISPDLILMDIRMPVMDGIAATKIIKNDPKLKHISIIALSASVMDDEIQKIQEVGFDDFLKKPVKLPELLKSLSKFLPNKQSVTIQSDKVETPEGNFEKLATDKVDAIKNLLLGEYFERWKNVSQGGFIDEITIFGNDLIETGIKFSCQTLIEFGKELVESTDSFDVGKMKKVLNSYNEILKKIKST